MALYYVSHSNWINFLQFLIKHYATYGMLPENEFLVWQKITADKLEDLVVSRFRGIHPVKGFFFPVKEEVTREPAAQKIVLLGVKACDLAQLQVMDAIFEQGAVNDPYYSAKRQNAILISSDCDAVRPSCFCTKMGGQPFPQKSFDLNVTPVRTGFLIETGSKQGEELIKARKHLFQDPQPYHLQERENLRSKITGEVKKNNSEFTWTDPRELVTKTYDSEQWQEIAKTCVECDACRFACGSCYCFLLSDTSRAWEKIRTWDSCQSCGYARVAGGGNPRKAKAERLRNLYMCKFAYRPENFGVSACTGCGRCIEVCQGKIDIRKSLQKLSEKK